MLNAGRSALAAILLALFAGAGALAETPMAPAPKQRMPIFIDPGHFAPPASLAPPPAADSLQTKAELAELHQIQSSRTPQELAHALADDHDESIFIFASVFGPGFNEAALPKTAELGRIIRNDAGFIENPAKAYFQRTRPYGVDPSISGCPHDPAKPLKTSYPSGHAMNGYAYGFILAQIVPSKADAILARAQDYADQRVVCGLHYRSDIYASEVLAGMFAREMISVPGFRAHMDAALAELRAAHIVD